MESGNDYVLQVKGNQKKLLTKMKATIENTDPVDIAYSLEKNRGREERREVYQYNIENTENYKEWSMASSIIHVLSTGIRKAKPYEEHRYYLTNKTLIDAEGYNVGIREHWGIENRLHWVKDVIMKEDSGLVRSIKRSSTLSVVRNIVISIYRQNGYDSIKYATEKFTNCINECIDLIHRKNYILKL